MRLRWLPVGLIVGAWMLVVLAMGWPAVALVAQSLAQDKPPTDGFVFSSRQLGLLWRSGWLAGIASLLCIVVSLPAAFVVGRARRLHRRPLLAGFFLAALLIPPMVYAFGWERILPTDFHPSARCVVVWASWAWPIPALWIGMGWSVVGRQAYEASLLVASPAAAFLRAALPLLIRYVVLSALILFVLFFGDYGVPHACGLLVYATELLGWAAGSGRVIDTIWLSLPAVFITIAAMIGAWKIWRKRMPGGRADGGGRPDAGRPACWLDLCALGWYVLACVVPLAVLVIKLVSLRVLIEAYQTYQQDLIWSIVTATTSGVLVVGLGLGVASVKRLRAVGFLLAVGFAALPGALVGEALVAGYDTFLWGVVYDHFPIVILGYVARFAWVGVLLAWVVTISSDGEMADQARTDGATPWGVLGHIQLPANWPLLVVGVAVVAALSLAEVPTSSLVRVPAFAPIAQVLIEKYHRFEDGMLVSLSLWLVGAAIPAVSLLALTLRRSQP